MSSFFDLDVGAFMPHGHCVLWKEEILFPMVASDGLIFLSYSAIPFAIYVFYKKRLDLTTDAKKILLLFVLFIQLCGFTHLISAYNYWNAQYYWELFIKIGTALVSVATAFVVYKNLNNLLAIPSPAQYAEANKRLKELNENLAKEVQAQTEEIRKDKELLEAVFNGIDDGIMEIFPIKNDAGEIVDFKSKTLNDRIMDHTGMTKEELNMPSMNERTPDYRTNGRFEIYCDILKTGETVRLDPSTWRVNGRIFRAIYTKNTISESILLFLSNITEREHLKNQALANSRLSALGELAGGVAHEINSPLQIISGASRQIKRSIKEPSDKQNESFQLVDTTIRRISRIISNLKRLSHESSSELTRIDLKSFLNDVRDFISTKVKTNSVELKEPYLKKDTIFVTGNEVALSQIVMNLVNNAIDELNESKEPLDDKIIGIDVYEDELKVYLEVSDNGNGVPEDSVDKIFTPLYTSKDVGKGTGLGLSLSSKLAKDMNAHLELVQDGKTRFRVVFSKDKA